MKIIILGDGGHSKVIQEMIFSARTHKVIAILDDKYDFDYQKKNIIYGPIASLPIWLRADTRVIVALGDNKMRKKVTEQLSLKAEQYITVMHPSAVVSPEAEIESGTVIMPHAVINARSRIGRHCIINTGAIVEHDNIVGNYAHLSPNATLTGNVTVGEGGHIGAAAVIIPGKEVGSWSVIGAGSTVIESVPSYSKAVGSPCRIIERLLVK